MPDTLCHAPLSARLPSSTFSSLNTRRREGHAPRACAADPPHHVRERRSGRLPRPRVPVAHGGIRRFLTRIDDARHALPRAVVGALAEQHLLVRLALVQQIPRITYANGDQADYLDLVFRCEWVSGDPHPADGELTEVLDEV
jgi:hypothetical protein